MYAIETKDLEKVYGTNSVVNKVNLNVERGIIFGFLGKNGAGKSTFINMLTGLTQPTSGTYQLASRKEKVGVLPDYSTLYDDMTALDHLKYFNKLLKAEVQNDQLVQLLKDVGLNDAIHLKAKKYSFGMKKKLAFAQAMLNNPEIVFLDEPTSGVDANSILTIHDLMKKLARQGTTVFFTSHNLDEVEKLSDKIAIMDQGRIKVQGDMEYLKSSIEQDIKVDVKFMNDSTMDTAAIEQKLSEFVTECHWEPHRLQATLKSKQDVSTINKILVLNDVEVYAIDLHEPSLEEIFIKTGQTSQ